jgi:hypothetical protein
MGVYYSARIIVGLTHEELEEFLQDVEDPEDVGLDRVSPYFDADDNESLFGVLVKDCSDFSYTEIDEVSWADKVCKAHQEFTKITGKKGKLFLSTYGS